MTEPIPTAPRPSVADYAMRAGFFLVLVLLMVGVPKLPSVDLDSSWRMALGYFFHHGLQFGRDVVFTYGPLGFLMGRTYCGLQFASLVAWQVGQALVFSVLIFRLGYRLQGYARLAYFVFFFLLGGSYEDALHQMMIALAGFALIGGSGREGRLGPALGAALLALLGLFKFTNLMLGAFLILAAVALRLWLRRPREALWLAAWFAGLFLAGWLLCGQNLLLLPAYLRNSWEVSQGYQDAMGLPTPPAALWRGLVVLALVITYAAVRFLGQSDRPRAVATTVALGAYTYLNWKHGFVRADGHMIGFYYCVLFLVTAFPVLLGDGPRFRGWSRAVLVAAGLLSLSGIETALPGVLRGALGGAQERFFTSWNALAHWSQFRANYEYALQTERVAYDMPATREAIGSATVDVLGHDQAVAIYNQFNYHPRPVFQGYSAYTPALARMNAAFYASAAAPEYVLFRMESIDRRFSTFDDAEVLALLAQRYEYVLNEKGFHLWHRKPGPFDLAAIAPRPLLAAERPIGTPVSAEGLTDRPLWATVDVRLSLLGRLRAFFYKPPLVQLRIADSRGTTEDYRMPLPQGRTGFIINPIVEDLVSYMRFAGGIPERRLRSLAVEIAPQDRDCFADTARVTYGALPPSDAGKEFFAQAQRLRFHMFKTAPVSAESQEEVAEERIGDVPVMVMHAPSEMAFDVPEGAHAVTGRFGFMPGAYTKGGRTDGAEFIVYCKVGATTRVLFSRLLDPVNAPGDRGLQRFEAVLPATSVNRVYLKVSPGPANNYSWDWTVWTEVEVK